MKNIEYYLNKFLDLIYKKKCYFCKKSKHSVKMCPECYGELILNDYKVEKEICGAKVYIAGCYEKYLQKMIRGIKYHRQKELAYYQAKFMWEYFSRLIEIENLDDDYQVVPIPLHKKRMTKRGYNQMELVGEEFCRLSKFSLNTKLVKRIKDTKPQYKLTKQERMKNLENAFQIDINHLENKPILLIDDICTTGSTFEAVIEELGKSGISNITCFATSSPN